MIELKNIEFYYDKNEKIFEGLNLSINKGEKLVVLGENGAGKSTLFKLLNALYKLKKGDFVYKNEKFTYTKKSLFNLRKEVSINFQDPDTQIFAPDIFQEISYGLVNIGLEEKEIIKRVDEISSLCGLDSLLDKPVKHLSYGQKKLLSIASNLVMDSELYIFDEPTTWLDNETKKKVLEILDVLHKKGKGIILSTHNVDLAYEFANRIIILKKGKILYDGGVEVFHNEKLLVEAKLNKPITLKVIDKLKEMDMLKDVFDLEGFLKEI